jgi:hypothetical protein
VRESLRISNKRKTNVKTLSIDRGQLRRLVVIFFSIFSTVILEVMFNPNIAALLKQLSPVSWAGSAATGSFSFVSGHSGTYSSGGGATHVRLVRTDNHGSQLKCRH